MPKVHLDDTIAALSTPPGEGGIAILRLSGREALAIADGLFYSKSGKKLKDAKPQRVLYGKIVDSEGKVWDQVLVTYFKAPHSYTGEDVIEISCHGGLRVSRSLLELLIRTGARPAEPGAFTRRAFLNGRLDLVQAEAVLDVIKAKTEASLDQAERQLTGELSRMFQEIRSDITVVYAEVEATLDFPEEDKEVYESLDLAKSLAAAQSKVQKLLKTRTRGRLLRDGVTIAIAGKPNAGKSSLLNALLKKERAIVTDVPGTTRDTIEEWVEIAGFPVKLIDTAGITKTKDRVEAIGIERTFQAIQEAHLVLVLFDGSRKFDEEDRQIFQSIPQEKEKIICITKSDLPQKLALPAGIGDPACSVSALKDQGLDKLEKAVEAFLSDGTPHESALVTNVRHGEALERALQALQKSTLGFKEHVSLEFIAEDLKEALGAIGEVVGEVYTEDLLGVIFSRFCIGK